MSHASAMLALDRNGLDWLGAEGTHLHPVSSPVRMLTGNDDFVFACRTIQHRPAKIGVRIQVLTAIGAIEVQGLLMGLDCEGLGP